VNKFFIISYAILEKFKKFKISSHLCLHNNQNWQLFLTISSYRRIRIRNSWFSVWGSGSEIINFGSGTLLSPLFQIRIDLYTDPDSAFRSIHNLDPGFTYASKFSVQSKWNKTILKIFLKHTFVRNSVLRI